MMSNPAMLQELMKDPDVASFYTKLMPKLQGMMVEWEVWEVWEVCLVEVCLVAVCLVAVCHFLVDSQVDKSREVMFSACQRILFIS